MYLHIQSLFQKLHGKESTGIVNGQPSLNYRAHHQPTLECLVKDTVISAAEKNSLKWTKFSLAYGIVHRSEHILGSP